jgi:hypothetical protein
MRCTADDNLLSNGDLAEGTGAAPADWVHYSPFDHFSNSDITAFSWKGAPGTPGELTITNTQPDFARWSQTLSLTPGWYLLSGEMRIEGADSDLDAQLGVDQGKTALGVSPDPQRQAQWTQSAFYFKVGAVYERVRIDCQLNSTGVASFRNLRLVRYDGPRDPATTQYDFDLTWLYEVSLPKKKPRGLIGKKPHVPRRASKPFPHLPPPSNGTIWPVLAIMTSVVAVAIFGWVRLGGDALKDRHGAQDQS